MMRKLYLVQVLQTVFPTYQHLLNEARQMGDMEIIDHTTYQMLRSRGFKMKVEETQ